MAITRRAWFVRGLLALSILLQLLASSAAVEGVWDLIKIGTPIIVPSVLAAPMLAAACYIVALTASIGRPEQTAWRMYAVVTGEAAAAAVLMWGVARGGLALAEAGPLPRNEWGREFELLGTYLSEGLSVLLTPIPVMIAGIHAVRYPDRTHGLPGYVVATALVCGAGSVAASVVYFKQFEARHQPDVLVRQLVGDGLMRPHARVYLTHMTALEREPARPALIEALKASDPEGQVAAASVLGVTEADPGFVAVRLARLLETIGLEPAEGSQRPLATEAARVLASMGPDAAPAVPALMDRIRRPPADVSEESVVVSAVRALQQIGEPARTSVPLLLLQVLEGTSPFVQEVAARTVDLLDPALARRCTGSSTLQEATREAAHRRERIVLTPGCADIPPDLPTSRER